MKDKRSIKQNSAIHLYFTQLAEALNNAGYSVTKVMKHDAEIPWSPNLVKELLWRQVQEIMTDIESVLRYQLPLPLHLLLLKHVALHAAMQSMHPL